MFLYIHSNITLNCPNTPFCRKAVLCSKLILYYWFLLVLFSLSHDDLKLLLTRPLPARTPCVSNSNTLSPLLFPKSVFPLCSLTNLTLVWMEDVLVCSQVKVVGKVFNMQVQCDMYRAHTYCELMAIAAQKITMTRITCTLSVCSSPKESLCSIFSV